MIPLYEAALFLQRFCEERGWLHCFIGGLALQRWSEPRYTQDADLTLLTDFIHDEAYTDALLTTFAPRRPASLVPKSRTEAAAYGTNGGRQTCEQRARTFRGNSMARRVVGVVRASSHLLFPRLPYSDHPPRSTASRLKARAT